MIKKYLKDIIIVSVLVISVTIFTYHVLNLIVKLQSELYISTAIGCFYTICIIRAFEYFQNKKLYEIIFGVILFLLIFPFVGIYLFHLGYPNLVTIEVIASAGFGAVFGVTVGTALEILLLKNR